MAETFRGKRVVVTGAAGGIGTALCSRFAREGANVVAVDRDETGLARLADVHPVVVDLTDPDRAMAALGGLGPVDVLVNNAGVTALGPAAEIPARAVEQVMATNVLGSVNATRALLEPLVDRRGRIAVMSSVAGFAPLLNRTAYSASKHALHGYFGSLRAEQSQSGLSITIVCPAFADTGIETRAVARAEGSSGEWSTTGRRLTADAVAAKAISGLRRRKRLVLVGRTAKLSYWTWRISPVLYERLMRSRIS